MKRTKELIKIINDTITESDVDTSTIPGVKWVYSKIQCGMEYLLQFQY
jgi:hypothetical protein